MGVVHLPPHSRWVADARGAGRRVRVSAHADEGVVVLSVWDHDRCVATARLEPAEAAEVIEALAEGLAALAGGLAALAQPRNVGTDPAAGTQ